MQVTFRSQVMPPRVPHPPGGLPFGHPAEAAAFSGRPPPGMPFLAARPPMQHGPPAPDLSAALADQRAAAAAAAMAGGGPGGVLAGWPPAPPPSSLPGPRGPPPGFMAQVPGSVAPVSRDVRADNSNGTFAESCFLTWRRCLPNSASACFAAVFRSLSVLISLQH